MPIVKTLYLIECRMCNGSYYAGDERLTLYPGDESKLPDEVAVVVRKVGRCQSCKQVEDRTRGGKRKRFER